jgi:ribonuclease HII
LWQKGYRHIAGVDEVGRGALAGPVVAAAVIVPGDSRCAEVWAEVRDSKLLPPGQRTALATRIKAAALAWGIGLTAAPMIDVMGIAAATRQAMRAAIDALTPRPDYLLIDWVKLSGVNIAQESRIKADRDLVSVAAASILAKVYRDQWMTLLHEDYPLYGFADHKGYSTLAHRAALDRHGPCPQHRYSFAPLAQPLTLFSGCADGPA